MHRGKIKEKLLSAFDPYPRFYDNSSTYNPCTPSTSKANEPRQTRTTLFSTISSKERNLSSRQKSKSSQHKFLMLESKSRKAKNIGSSFEGEVSDEERQQAQAIDDGPSICASKPFEEPDNRVTVNSVAQISKIRTQRQRETVLQQIHFVTNPEKELNEIAIKHRTKAGTAEQNVPQKQKQSVPQNQKQSVSYDKKQSRQSVSIQSRTEQFNRCTTKSSPIDAKNNKIIQKIQKRLFSNTNLSICSAVLNNPNRNSSNQIAKPTFAAESTDARLQRQPIKATSAPKYISIASPTSLDTELSTLSPIKHFNTQFLKSKVAAHCASTAHCASSALREIHLSPNTISAAREVDCKPKQHPKLSPATQTKVINPADTKVTTELSILPVQQTKPDYLNKPKYQKLYQKQPPNIMSRSVRLYRDSSFRDARTQLQKSISDKLSKLQQTTRSMIALYTPAQHTHRHDTANVIEQSHNSHDPSKSHQYTSNSQQDKHGEALKPEHLMQKVRILQNISTAKRQVSLKSAIGQSERGCVVQDNLTQLPIYVNLGRISSEKRPETVDKPNWRDQREASCFSDGNRRCTRTLRV